MIFLKTVHKITTVKESADTNLFIQAGVNLGIEVGASYSLNELLSTNGISLKVGGNVFMSTAELNSNTSVNLLLNALHY